MRLLHLCMTIYRLAQSLVFSCDDSCANGHGAAHTRLVRRMQPGARNAVTGPDRPLKWGQINFLHTTDTHGWLAGHLRESNYGADWGDFLSFTKAMKAKASSLGVDLLLVDTGDLHTGAGLSDVTLPPGAITDSIFSAVDYDLLTIGNYELYDSRVTYEQYNKFAKHFGDRYLTSNVDIRNPISGQWEPIGRRYRYFTTVQGLRIMAFGVLFDFTGNSKISRVTKASDVVRQQWFKEAVNYADAIDLFVILGHNPVSIKDSRSSIGIYQQAVRRMRPDVPIQIFGGHAHTRDFVVYDEASTGLASGRFCETLGWLSISGFNATSSRAKAPVGLPNTNRLAKRVPALEAGSQAVLNSIPNRFLYSRRYLDWNRLTFDYHVRISQNPSLGSREGERISNQITSARDSLNLTTIYGCAPQTWCADCAPNNDTRSLFVLINNALSTIVVNQTRASTPRLYIYNGGNVRFDLITQGPFSYDDSYVVLPFKNTFRFIPDVPYRAASRILSLLNTGRHLKHKRYVDDPELYLSESECKDPAISSLSIRSVSSVVKYQTAISPGYTTTDDFGTNGDDTRHEKVPYYPRPNVLQANSSFPTDETLPVTVDLIFTSFVQRAVLDALDNAGMSYTAADVELYMPANFTSDMLLGEYAKQNWQTNVHNCPFS